jgi:adenine phosphoribosyltransferase
MQELKKYVRMVPDFPRPGVSFYDITTLLADPAGFKLALGQMEKYVLTRRAQRLVGIESRGFLFAAALADRLNIGLAVARKPGKLPFRTVSRQYDLEYGTDSVELHQDAVAPGERVVVVDDLIATGGTLQAVCQLVEQLGAEVAGVSAVIDLSFLPWREKLAGHDVNCLVSFDSE